MAGTFVEGWEDGLDLWPEDALLPGTGFMAITTDWAFGCTHSLRIDSPDNVNSPVGRVRTGLPGSGNADQLYYLSAVFRLPTGFWAAMVDPEGLAPNFVLEDGGSPGYVTAAEFDPGGQVLQGPGGISPVLVEETNYFFEASLIINSADDSYDLEMWLDGVSWSVSNSGAGALNPGTVVDGLSVFQTGSDNNTGAFYYIDTFEWSQLAQIGPVQAADETCVVPGTGGRFLSSPPWRWVVTTLNSQVVTFLDHVAMDKEVTHYLNRPSEQACRLPSDNPEVNILFGIGTEEQEPFVSEGNRLLYCFRREGGDPQWKIRASGIILQLEDDADSADTSTAYTHLGSYDPWQYLYNRPVVNLDGSLPGENGISFTATATNVIALTLIRNTILNHGMVHLDVPTLFGGSGFWAGTNQTTAQIDINFEQGTSVGEALDQLAETDTIDFEIRPIWDPINRPGYTSELSLWIEMGSTRFSSIFAWDRPSHSLVQLSRLKDGTQRANYIRFQAGQGGENGAAADQIDAASVAKYGEYHAQQFFPKQTVVEAVEALAAAQLTLRKNGKTTVTFSPAPERAPMLYTEYFLGDRVPVYASRNFRQEMGGPAADPLLQRIYGIPIKISDNGVEEVQRLVTAVR